MTSDSNRTFALAKAFVMMNRHLMSASTDPEAFAAEYVAFVRYAGNIAAAPNDPKSLYIRVQLLLVDLTPENVAAAAQEVESMPVDFQVMFWTEAIKQGLAREWASKSLEELKIPVEDANNALVVLGLKPVDIASLNDANKWTFTLLEFAVLVRHETLHQIFAVAKGE